VRFAGTPASAFLFGEVTPDAQDPSAVIRPAMPDFPLPLISIQLRAVVSFIRINVERRRQVATLVWQDRLIVS
jgi:hypothetical protein